MMGLVYRDEMDNDVKGDEDLIERNKENRNEIDESDGKLKDFEIFGKKILKYGNYESVEIKEKLERMNEDRKEIEKDWIESSMKIEK
jgi:hypothetical protein